MESLDSNRVQPPVVLVLAGLDPTGGAGLAADITSLAALGCHVAPVASCLTVQNSEGVTAVEAISTDLILEQLQTVIEDCSVSAIKLGLMPTTKLITAVHEWLGNIAAPVVCDPVLWAGGNNAELTLNNTRPALVKLLTHCSLATPNQHELFALAETDELEQARMALLDQGLSWLLVTGTDAAPHSDEIQHQLHGPDCSTAFFSPRRPGNYHGSGCTLTAAIAGFLAHGDAMPVAVERGLAYTADTIDRAYQLGPGQAIPNRLSSSLQTP